MVKAFWERRAATLIDGRALGSTPAGGLGGAGRRDRLRTGLDMVTDILRYVPLAVHSA
jgi:hypothetical protein